MTSLHFGRTHGQMTPGVECYHRHWKHMWKDDIGREMPSSPFDYTHGGTTLGMSYHHLPFTKYTVVLHLAWHAIIALGLHKWSDNIGHVKRSSPMDNIHRFE